MNHKTPHTPQFYLVFISDEKLRLENIHNIPRGAENEA